MHNINSYGVESVPGPLDPGIYLLSIKQHISNFLQTVKKPDTTSPEYLLWIIKFAAENDFHDVVPVEYAYSLMAREAGISKTTFKKINAIIVLEDVDRGTFARK